MRPFEGKTRDIYVTLPSISRQAPQEVILQAC
jgi:hypothetical protein